MKRYIVTVVICLLAGAGVRELLTTVESKPALTTDDRYEIQDLLYTNHTGYDFAENNCDMWTNTFTEDAVLDNPPTHLVGRDAIRAYCVDPAKKAPGRRFRHWTSTFHAEPNKDGAIMTAFYLVVSDGDGNGAPMMIGGTGRYASQVVKTKAGWKIKHHVVFGEGAVYAKTPPPPAK